MTLRIAVIAPGEMGAGIGGRLRRHGASVVTLLDGRSPRSAERARAAGMEAAADATALLAGTDLLLSILPPASALDLARQLAPALAATGGRVTYADCNAVAPDTVRTVAEVVTATGCPFVDIGIIGAPPKTDDPGPRLYASGEAAGALSRLRDLGLDLRVMEGDIGAASALKMAYATLTKGLTALGVAARLEAAAGGVEAALQAELAASQPALTAWLARQVPSMPPKAYRWVGEMEEIAATLRTTEAPAAAPLFTGAAGLYAHIARDPDKAMAALAGFYAAGAKP